jgi:hypothetical protein
LIDCAWEYLNEGQQVFFKTKYNFRKYIEGTAGHCEPYYHHRFHSWIDVPKSIDFEKMDNAEFQDLYERVRNVLFASVLRNIPQEEFEKNLINF